MLGLQRYATIKFRKVLSADSGCFWIVQEKGPRVNDFKLAFFFLGFDMEGEGRWEGPSSELKE